MSERTLTEYERGRLDVRRELTAAIERFNDDDNKGIGDIVDVLNPFLLSGDELAVEHLTRDLYAYFEAEVEAGRAERVDRDGQRLYRIVESPR